MNLKFSILLQFFLSIYLNEACTSLYCINKCGSSKINSSKKGFKLILANNRDEDIYRKTLPASIWPAKSSNRYLKTSLKNIQTCEEIKSKNPNDLCVYGALDLAKGEPPQYYSTWLGINERGSVGNLLFYMQPSSHIVEKYGRGIIVGSYLQNSTWKNVDEFMQYLTDTKSDFKPFNYVQLEMNKLTGDYSLYYLNNNNSKIYKKLNEDEKSKFIFGLSNSDSNRPFNKVKLGKTNFELVLNEYSSHLNKEKLVNDILNILQNSTSNYPDETLESYLNTKNVDIIKGISQVNADYGTYWKNAYSRTSTIILVDYDDNVDYYEYNLTDWKSVDALKGINDKKWEMNSFSFKLKPLYKNTSYDTKKPSIILLILISNLIFYVL